MLFLLTGKSSELTPQQQRTVLENINQVLYYDLGFHGNTEDYYFVMNSYINQVNKVANMQF